MRLVTAAEIELRCRHGERRLAMIREQYGSWFETRIILPHAREMLMHLQFDLALDDSQRRFDQLRIETEARFDNILDETRKQFARIKARLLTPSNP